MRSFYIHEPGLYIFEKRTLSLDIDIDNSLRRSLVPSFDRSYIFVCVYLGASIGAIFS